MDTDCQYSRGHCWLRDFKFTYYIEVQSLENIFQDINQDIPACYYYSVLYTLLKPIRNPGPNFLINLMINNKNDCIIIDLFRIY